MMNLGKNWKGNIGAPVFVNGRREEFHPIWHCVEVIEDYHFLRGPGHLFSKESGRCSYCGTDGYDNLVSAYRDAGRADEFIGWYRRGRKGHTERKVPS